MSEFRQNPANHDWIILATERAKRPDSFKSKEPRVQRPKMDPACIFCEGNEEKTTGEIWADRGNTAPNAKGWKIRVIPNKFPAVQSDVRLERIVEGIYRKVCGYGKHEVIIETPSHDLCFGNMNVNDVYGVLITYKMRLAQLMKDPHIQLVMIFENHGKRAGASQEHAHSQIIAVPIIPNHIRNEIDAGRNYTDDNGTCVYCDMIKEEIEKKARIVLETAHFVAFEPFASRTPFETWIVPKRHESSFEHITDDELLDLAGALGDTMAKLYNGLDDPDYNLMIHTAPRQEDPADYYHWHIQIVPKLTTPAGFELGTGIYINSAVPADSAKFLRETKIDKKITTTN